MDDHSNKCITHPVYVLEDNPLAAEHLQRILLKDRQYTVKIISSPLSSLQLPAEDKRCVLVVSQTSITSPLAVFAEELEKCFQDFGVVFVGELGFWQELQQLESRDHVALVTYADVAKKLVPAVRRIANRLYPEPGLFGRNRFDAGSEKTVFPQKMTRREAEILELVQYRLSNKEIASILNVAEVTVKFHVSNILSKARVDRRRNLLALIDNNFSSLQAG
jgi:DNA-binding NarL/FixJ family response regulator